MLLQDFSNIDHSITEHVFINIIRAGEVVLESRGYLADFLVCAGAGRSQFSLQLTSLSCSSSTEDITHIRGFPRKFRTYDVEPSGLQAAVGDRIEVMGRFLGIETWYVFTLVTQDRMYWTAQPLLGLRRCSFTLDFHRHSHFARLQTRNCFS